MEPGGLQDRKARGFDQSNGPIKRRFVALCSARRKHPPQLRSAVPPIGRMSEYLFESFRRFRPKLGFGVLAGRSMCDIVCVRRPDIDSRTLSAQPQGEQRTHRSILPFFQQKAAACCRQTDACYYFTLSSGRRILICFLFCRSK